MSLAIRSGTKLLLPSTISHPYVTESVWQRFISKVKVDSYDCWIWTASTARGYGKFHVEGKFVRSHRWAWEAVNGKMPRELDARHTCDEPLCCNPKHILPGTRAQNMADMISRERHARQKVLVCPKCGGPFTQYKDRRRCVPCTSESRRKRKQRH